MSSDDLRPTTSRRDRVIEAAKAALGRIADLDLLPDPVTFEVLFTYHFGGSPELVREIDRLLVDGGLTPSDVQAVFERHLGPARKMRELLSIGEGLRTGVHEVGVFIGSANSQADRYGDGLASATERLARMRTHQALNDLVSGLMKSTMEAKRANSRLQEGLRRSEGHIRQLQVSIELLQAESVTDPVTEIGNRSLFDHSIGRMVDAARESGDALALLLIDVDRFKDFNDRYGHQIGDDVLRLVAATIKQHIRHGDLVARYGGDEFTVLLPGSSVTEGRAIGERIRRSVSEKELIRRATHERLGRISLSVGVAELARDGTAERLIEAADSCLFRAKREGRDRVVG